MPVCSVMANSRKRTPKPDPVERQLLDALRAAVAENDEVGAASSADGAAAATPTLIAFSGGRDSTALLDAACRLRRSRASGLRQLIAVHVHHGLAAEAERWADFCKAMCERLEVPLDLRRVRVERTGRGIEDAARVARYEALAAAAAEYGAIAVLTAHHRDDRIESFLMHWLRGAGLSGLTGFAATRRFAEGRALLLRPWLAVPRADIEYYVQLHELAFVEDPSNAEPRLLRSALRTQVLPVLRTIRPGFLRPAARSIELLTEAAEVIEELAAADLMFCTAEAPEGMLRLDRLGQLSDARRATAVRAWLAAQGEEAPPRARLQQIITQALARRSDTRMRVRIGGREVRRHRGYLLLRAASVERHGEATVHWDGEGEIAVPAWGGVLRFVATTEAGFERDWLRAAPLHLRGRGGGERFKPHATRPSKTLKRLFQDAGIAEFERAALPLVWRDDRLIYVAGLGADARLVDTDGPRIRLQWQADAALLQQ